MPATAANTTYTFYRKMSSYKKTLQSLRGDYQRAVEKQEREGLLGGREAVSSAPALYSCCTVSTPHSSTTWAAPQMGKCEHLNSES